MDPVEELIGAAMVGNAERVQKLLDAGVDPNATEEGSHRRALAYAANAESVDTVSILLDAGAEIDATDCDGWTPLMVATSSRSEAIAARLARSHSK